ncbi:hypothetical protein ABH920_004748 [Catenulispora sp. EB89]|uniref:hypothetical protein n=1 Tax=Catenulispora sp. EB89 TaxID=3156257 RepID=UPI003512FCA9
MTGTWFVLGGWTAAAIVVPATVVFVGLLAWTLAGAARTARLRFLIIALRSRPRRPAEK